MKKIVTSILITSVFFCASFVVSADTSCKTYMDYRKITDENSDQYKLLASASVDIETGIMLIGDTYYCVAMGSAWGPIGSTFKIVLSSGSTFSVIKADEKADCDTDRTNKYDPYGGIIEFIIDSESGTAKENIWSNGYVWQGNFNNNPQFEGEIETIEELEGICCG